MGWWCCSGWMFICSFWFKSIWVPVSSLHCWFPICSSLFHFCNAFTFSCILGPYSTNGASCLPVFWTLHLIGWLSLHHLVLLLELWSVISFGPYFFVLAYLLCCKGRDLRYFPGWGVLHGGAICGGGVREGTMLLAWLSAHFQSFPPLPTSKLGPPGADSRVGGFVYILGPCGSLQRTLLRGWKFLQPLHPPQVFTVWGFEALFPRDGTLSCAVCLYP